MAGNAPLSVDHVGHSAFPQVDAADHIVERVVFIDAYYIERRFSIFLHRHSHGNAQLALIDSRGIGRQIIRLFQKRPKIAAQAFRRAVQPLRQPSVQVV